MKPQHSQRRTEAIQMNNPSILIPDALFTHDYQVMCSHRFISKNWQFYRRTRDKAASSVYGIPWEVIPHLTTGLSSEWSPTGPRISRWSPRCPWCCTQQSACPGSLSPCYRSGVRSCGAYLACPSLLYKISPQKHQRRWTGIHPAARKFLFTLADYPKMLFFHERIHAWEPVVMVTRDSLALTTKSGIITNKFWIYDRFFKWWCYSSME